MKFAIKKCIAWGDGKTCLEDWQAFANNVSIQAKTLTLPELKQIPAMQRRRLSAFAKLTLHCALTASDTYQHEIPSVFSSRHGDLHKTSKLIADVASKEALSPTHFGLSVHNAVGGLFSIYTGNKAPLSAVSAGEDSFFMGLVDAVAKLHTRKYKRILYVYSDQAVPEHYQNYVQQHADNIAVGLLIEASDSVDNYSIECVGHDNVQSAENLQLQALDFLKFYFSQQQQLSTCSKRYKWQLTRS
ncbi:beta-ketoacyl synthase chain length factor [Pseudoalteromonas sp. NEC-BIFX-2020_015]|uniref:beta-ketoacyl synthase chain length factor n=1 Tax=Pseudoalteromonas sp. NEC-BIFX-2020_015 TaxID=2729544 RepID=UPI0014615A75|nr:beta-ketoacyl synthase chain length factor [Pseudoalteromonas sp. NEC-BIFX-2020_015]NMR25663.1 beta-ketoacyl synthase chain length factor [Pseudoalteromonas sp. NEC-BIFX-2020_015]